MKVEIVIMSNMVLCFGSLDFDLWITLSFRSAVKGQRPETKDHVQIFMLSIFLTISIPVTCRNNAVTIK
jgi:hypothetical protein